MKKAPARLFDRQSGRKPILGVMADESILRRQSWLHNGCNAFEGSHIASKPLSFWREQDVLRYAKEHGTPVAKDYGEIVCDCESCHTTGVARTGCLFCGFGAHLEKNHRFIYLRDTYPRLYEYCMNGGQWVDNPSYDPTKRRQEPDGWINWNPRKIWQPSSKGLGLRYVLNTINEIYGKGTIPFE